MQLIPTKALLDDKRVTLAEMHRAEFFEFLNVSPSVVLRQWIPAYHADKRPLFRLSLELSNSMIVEKRKVLNILNVLGEIGGLKEIYSQILGLFIGIFPARLFMFARTKDLFV